MKNHTTNYLSAACFRKIKKTSSYTICQLLSARDNTDITSSRTVVSVFASQVESTGFESHCGQEDFILYSSVRAPHNSSKTMQIKSIVMMCMSYTPSQYM